MRYLFFLVIVIQRNFPRNRVWFLTKAQADAILPTGLHFLFMASHHLKIVSANQRSFTCNTLCQWLRPFSCQLKTDMESGVNISFECCYTFIRKLDHHLGIIEIPLKNNEIIDYHICCNVGPIFCLGRGAFTNERKRFICNVFYWMKLLSCELRQ